MRFQLAREVFRATAVQFLFVKSSFAALSKASFDGLDKSIDIWSPVDCIWDCSDEVDCPAFATNAIQLSTCTNCVSATSYENSFRIQCSACKGSCVVPAHNQCNLIAAESTGKRGRSKRNQLGIGDSTGSKTKHTTITEFVPDIGFTTEGPDNEVFLTISSFTGAIFTISINPSTQFTYIWSYINNDGHGSPVTRGGIITLGDPIEEYVKVGAIPGERISLAVI